jgi:hypothetical protein
MNEIQITPPETVLTPTTMGASELLSMRLVFAHGEADHALQLPPSGLPWVMRDDHALRLDPTPLRSLFRGASDPGEFGSTPSPEYDPVFSFLEVQLGRVVAARGTPLRDDEAVDLFSAMRRRPDGRYQSPLYVYFRAALQVLLTIRPTSEREFDAVLRRLERSARTFRADSASTNYHGKVLSGLLGSFTGA